MKSFVVITGATGGLGQAFARQCATRGWDLFLTGRNKQILEDLSKTLPGEYGIAVETHPADLTDIESRDRLFRRIAGMEAAPWMLITVAGLDFEGPFLDRTRHELVNIARVNVEATLDVTRAVLELRADDRQFRLLTVGSLAGFYPMPYKATYAASKAFLMSMSFALREELRRYGATCTLLAPAGLTTNPVSIAEIEAQGVLGRITTVETDKVVRLAVDATLAGRPLVVPGIINSLARWVLELLPRRLVAELLGSRWYKVQTGVPLDKRPRRDGPTSQL